MFRFPKNKKSLATPSSGGRSLNEYCRKIKVGGDKRGSFAAKGLKRVHPDCGWDESINENIFKKWGVRHSVIVKCNRVIGS